MANNVPIAYRADTGQQFQPRKGFWNWLQGNPELFQQVPKHSPEVAGQLQGLLGQTFQGLQNPQAGFQPIADQARRQFETQTVPGLAERFTSLGGGQRSSAFQNALGSAGVGLESDLAAMGSQYGLQNRQGLGDILNLLLKNQPEFSHRGRERGWLEGLLGPFLGGGKYRGAYGGQENTLEFFNKWLSSLL